MDGKEQDFRDACRDAAVIIERLRSQCRDFDEMLGVLKLAVGDETQPANDAQLRILLAIIFPPPPNTQRR